MKILKNLLLLLVLQSGFFIASAQSQFKALLVTATRGYQHESINAGVLAMQDLGKKNDFDVVLLQDQKSFTDNFLKQFQVIIFLNKPVLDKKVRYKRYLKIFDQPKLYFPKLPKGGIEKGGLYI